MRISDFKGKRGAKAMADLMRLAERVAGDPLVSQLFETAKKGDEADTVAAFAKLAPILEDDEVLDMAVAVIAKVKREEPEAIAEDGDIIGEFTELLMSDVKVPRFLASAAEMTQE